MSDFKIPPGTVMLRIHPDDWCYPEERHEDARDHGAPLCCSEWDGPNICVPCGFRVLNPESSKY